MSIRHASASWEGPFVHGRGRMKPEHADNVPFLVESRFGDLRGSNPEEMLGAALAGCFSMALAAGLERAGATPVSIRTDVSVQIERVQGHYEIVRIDLTTEVRAPDADELRLAMVAEETRKNCPIGRVLTVAPIHVKVALVGPKAQPSLGGP
jgi:osmotically inducible protein OsmC